MYVRQLFDHGTSTYSYLLADRETGEALLLDPVLEQAERDAELIRELGLRLLYTVETHVHADHVTGAAALQERFGSIIAAPAAAAACADMRIAEGDSIRFGRHALRALSTPGHTDACMSYVGEGRVFTGDTLLIRGCGRTDFQSGDAGRLWDSLQMLFRLPPETTVHPAHDYRGLTISTIGEELQFNPRIAGRSRAAFVELMTSLHLPMPSRIDVAVPANLQCGREHLASVQG